MDIRLALAVAASSALTSMPASGLVVHSQSGIMTASGQDFAFDFAGLGPSDGTGGTVTVASGPATKAAKIDDGFDLDGAGNTAEQEYFTVFADDLSLGSYDCAGRHGTTIPRYTLNGEADCIFSLAIPLAPGDLDRAIGDGAMRLAVNFARGVGDFGDGDQLNVSLAYDELMIPAGPEEVPDDVRYDDVVPTPLPATGLLLLGGLGIVGAIARRRKAKSQA
jgi:hypothetical protein